MSALPDRRGFLRRLAGLPLIGGSVALVGSPAAAAVPLSLDILDAYSHFLFHEQRALARERYAHFGPDMLSLMERSVPCNTLADRVHYPLDDTLPALPSTRAVVILSAAGVPLI